MKISYNWLKLYVSELPEAEKLSDIFTYKLCEVESVETLSDGDKIFDLKVLPDRAHDLLSHQGVAKEISGLLGVEYKDPSSMYKIPATVPTKLKVEIENQNCRRYMGRIIRNIKIGQSPEWVVKHLASIGQRSINNIIDATNIVMFDCGQPCHAFDAEKITNYELQITNADAGQKISLLGGQEVELKDADLIIADENKNPLAIAGVKGGIYAEITGDTENIMLEVANFSPTGTRKTARRLGLQTDAVKRFENDLSTEIAPYAMRELSSLILEMFPDAEFEEIVDIYPHPQVFRKINFSIREINSLLGIEIPVDEAETILKNYSYLYQRNGDDFIIDVPPMRIDLVGSCDMAEEIGRAYGYEKISPQIPKIDFTPAVNKEFYFTSLIRNFLLSRGFSEVYNYTFTKNGNLEVSAPLAKDKAFLRENLINGLKESLEKNFKHIDLLEMREVKIFEIGKIFHEGKETLSLAIGINKAQKKGIEDELDLLIKDLKSEIGVDILWIKDKNIIEINLSEVIKKMVNQDSYGDLLPTIKYQPQTVFKMWSQYPCIVRDVAIWLPEETNYLELSRVLEKNAGDFLITKPMLFDQFTKDGKTSFAFRLVFQSYEKTLTDDEVNHVMEGILNELKKYPNWQVR
ncbi:MAG: phenylalanine--tRNA ligase subunit beta [Candidatus Paceibacterota bacterium]|jgi:phenylalanyl-tRNA synthetase beta chain